MTREHEAPISLDAERIARAVREVERADAEVKVAEASLAEFGHAAIVSQRGHFMNRKPRKSRRDRNV